MKVTRTPLSLTVCTFLFCQLGTGCSAPSGPSAPAARHVPPSVAQILPLEYLESNSSGSRPSWLDHVPADKDGMHFQVGMSEFRTSQAEADEAAMQAALVKIGAYVGVRVSQVEEVVRRVSGQESGILDGTIDTTGRTNTVVNVLIARAKASQFYRQKFRAMRGSTFQGDAYSSAVLVTIPLDEIRTAKDWVENEKLAAEEEKLRAMAEHAARLEAIARTLTAAEVMRTLALLQEEWRRLDGVASDFEARGGSYQGQVAALRAAQRALLGKVNEVAAALHVDTGRLAFRMLPQTDGQTLSVWVWMKDAGRYRPVERLPLLLRLASGAVLGRTMTSKDGQADFTMAASWSAGEVRVSIDSEAPVLHGFTEEFLATLSRVEGRLTITPLPADLEGAVRGMLGHLFTGPALAPPKVGKVILGPITYGDSGQGSEFAYLLKKELSRYLTMVPGLEVVTPRPRNVAEVARILQGQTNRGPATGGGLVAEAPVTRGISIIGASSTQAVIDGADAALETVYSVRGGEVLVDLSLRQAASDVLLRSVSAALRREQLPSGIELIPRRDALMVPGQASTPAAGAIRLEVASHLGDGQTYAEGDTISYFVNLDHDAYLLLVYEDAAGHLIRILPNPFSGDGFHRAGSTLQIPTSRDPFEFTIAPPFGRERVWAFAASVPFPKLPGVELDNGLALLDGRVADLLRRIRTVADRPGVAYGEAQTMITTVSGKDDSSVRH